MYYHFKGEKRIVRDRRIREAKELAIFIREFNARLEAEQQKRRENQK